ncbi:DUF3823 domain-containing protein [Olivibacter sp. SDN3]|uniref:DUF3823 domain-containing protein n=1 Tax=Olivibacter sp. SDN3 TaxID=2764720 RepID=UPI001650F83C|nr:DUF3823 domain-containing protein [Olivibacter sp. SDN3]QNL50557.1 DUF3823 domain-containing protein [Olivibacter sp. SDN3]
MKKIIIYSVVLFTLLLHACEKDNYDAPQSELTGIISYQGEAIPVSYNDVIFELFEPGWQLRDPITVTVDQDGSYAALLFDADYKALFQANQGPFLAPSDSINITVRGNTTFDIEVLPYYMLRNPNLSVNGRELNATLNVEQVITDDRARDIEHITLYVGKTLFTDTRTAVAHEELSGSEIESLDNVSLQVTVPSLTPEQNYIFARVGLKIAGVEDMIFTPVQRLEL